MKNLIALITFVGFIFSVPYAFAFANGTSYALNQQWSRVQAWEKSQNRKFKKIERDAELGIGSFKDDKRWSTKFPGNNFGE